MNLSEDEDMDDRPLLLDTAAAGIQQEEASSNNDHGVSNNAQWSPLRVILMGQVVSLLLCGTAVFSEYLAQQQFNAPTTQSFLNYALIVSKVMLEKKNTCAQVLRRMFGNVIHTQPAQCRYMLAFASQHKPPTCCHQLKNHC